METCRVVPSMSLFSQNALDSLGRHKKNSAQLQSSGFLGIKKKSATRKMYKYDLTSMVSKEEKRHSSLQQTSVLFSRHKFTSLDKNNITTLI